MESIYYVLTWLCHRKCEHCYEDRFHPYYGEELDAVVAESKANFAGVIANLPERMTYLDTARPKPGGGFEEGIGRIVLSGGEVLLEQIREPVLYPAMDMFMEKYRDTGGARLIIQTTGDLVTEKIVSELLEHGAWTISVSGLDSHHKGMETVEARDRLRDKLTNIFESFGMERFDRIGDHIGDPRTNGHYFHFFGATEDSWIGPLWPRGRAHENEISTATLADNFCNRWSGGQGFLDRKHAGSEVSIDPTGNVYPCCIKTKLPVGNLLQDKLDTILDRHVGNPVYEAISMGHPERMGLSHGWSVADFLEKSRTITASGKEYRNLCIGCDRFHDEVLMPGAGLVQLESVNSAG
jgi:MoaA/NifB/PqqE/SkfB family radical SAM enzyme